MNLFLDTSVILAACASDTGASREVCRRAASHNWSLIITPYVISEVEGNLANLPSNSRVVWQGLRPQLEVGALPSRGSSLRSE